MWGSNQILRSPRTKNARTPERAFFVEEKFSTAHLLENEVKYYNTKLSRLVSEGIVLNIRSAKKRSGKS